MPIWSRRSAIAATATRRATSWARPSASKRFEGAQIDQWYAPNITAEALSKANGWDKSQLIAFLKKGAASNSTALGPMQEVVHDSLSFLTPSDLDAMATYLLDLTRREGRAEAGAGARKKLAPEVEKHAAKLYADNCASCHQANGQGIAGSIPPLAGNPAVVAAKPFDVLSVVLQGIPARADLPAMPSFAGSLNDGDVADLTNYVRTSWGNKAAPNATRALVATWRATLSLPVYASDAARRFDCPSVGQGGERQPRSQPDRRPGRRDGTALGRLRHAGRSSTRRSIRTPAWRTSSTISSPPIARSSRQAATSDQAKSLALKRFALTITSYLSNQSVTEAEPDVGIIWAVPRRLFARRARSRLAAGAEVPGQRQFARAAGAGDGGRADRGQARSEFLRPGRDRAGRRACSRQIRRPSRRIWPMP